MALGAIFTVLASIPWRDVIETAPKIAEGGSKLWNMVSRRKNINEESEYKDSNIKKKMTEIEIVKLDIDSLKENIDDLNLQMQVSADLIKDLTQNNLVLIEKIENNRSANFRINLILGFLFLTSIALNIVIIFIR
ncbi:MAG: hypothetical protein CFE38_09030 [Comamonadaceae bacterium PBBC1]|nr:MAG: hypothetical protein CFE38_09030 [Comamonadaceae bacterium PBBC1]